MMTDQIGVGANLPAFSLTSPEGQPITNADFVGKPLVLFFYPKDDTPGCTTENQDFSAMVDQFAAAGVELLGISKDPPARHAKFIAKYELKAKLASDPEEQGLSDALGIWLEKSMYGRTYMGMERTSLLIDGEGVIRQVWRKVKVKGHAAEVLAAAQNLSPK